MTYVQRVQKALSGRRERIVHHFEQARHDRNGDVEFIHINKTGGSSVERALGLPLNHETAQQRLDRLGADEWNRRFRFSVVRNPWDRAVSHFHHRSQQGRVSDDLDFASWIRATLVDRNEEVMIRPQMFAPQVSWLSSTDGKILVEEIIRFEELSAGFDRVAQRLGLDVTLPHVKRSKHRPYGSYYDQETVEIVGTAFAADVAEFGYEPPNLEVS